jgi:Matrixin
MAQVHAASRLTLGVLLAAALLLPASAGAQPPARGAARRDQLAGQTAQTPLVRATAVAERYWNAVPCAGKLSVRADMPLPRGLDPSTDAWVTFDSSLGENDLQAPADTYTGCTIGLARWQWPTSRSMQRDWNMFCLTITHEVGHLLGHPHSLLPRSVMAPVFTNEANVPSLCRATRTASR